MKRIAVILSIFLAVGLSTASAQFQTARPGTSTGGGSGAPTDAKYIVQVPNATLSAEQALSSLASALLLNTTGTGVLSAYGGTACMDQVATALSATGAASCATLTSAYMDSTVATKASGALNALVVNTSGGTLIAFSGTSCSNQVVTALSALGAANCLTLTSSYVDSTIATKASGALNALTINASGGALTAYAGTSCTNQLLRALSALGVASCQTVTSAYVDTSIVTLSGALTSGRVPYVSGSQSLADDSAFKWDNTGKRLTLPTTGQTLDAVDTNEKPQIHLGGDYDGVVAGTGQIYLDGYGAQSLLIFRRSGGTQASKTAPTTGSSVLSIRGESWDGSAYGLGGAFRLLANGNQSGSNHGHDFQWQATANGSTASPSEVMRLAGSGDLTLGPSATTSSFKWDATNKRIITSLDGGAVETPDSSTTPQMHLGIGTTGQGHLYIDGSNSQPTLTMRRYNGSTTSKTALADADIIFNFRGVGYETTNGSALGGVVRMTADGAWSNTNHGEDFVVLLTNNGSTAAPTEKLRVKSTGVLQTRGNIQPQTNNSYTLGDTTHKFLETHTSILSNSGQSSSATGTQNAFAVTSSVVYLNNSSDLTINGIAAGYEGQLVTFISQGAGNVFFAHQSGSAAAGDKLFNFVVSWLTPLAAGKGRATYRYNGSQWTLVEHEQGDFISFAFSAGNYTAGGSQTWTVASGDVTADLYYIKGHAMTWNFRYTTTTVGGTPATTLIRTFPEGNLRAGNWLCTILATDNGTDKIARTINTGTNTMAFSFIPAANWAAATDNSGVNGTCTVGLS